MLTDWLRYTSKRLGILEYCASLKPCWRITCCLAPKRRAFATLELWRLFSVEEKGSCGMSVWAPRQNKMYFTQVSSTIEARSGVHWGLGSANKSAGKHVEGGALFRVAACLGLLFCKDMKVFSRMEFSRHGNGVLTRAASQPCIMSSKLYHRPIHLWKVLMSSQSSRIWLCSV